MSEIWKLQRPLFASDGNLGLIMAYTEERNDTAMIPMPMEDIELLFHDDPKIYVLAHVDKRHKNLVVEHEVEEQAW